MGWVRGQRHGIKEMGRWQSIGREQRGDKEKRRWDKGKGLKKERSGKWKRAERLEQKHGGERGREDRRE